jgi:tetrahydromethanopterin S-methyltransferase subunit G
MASPDPSEPIILSMMLEMRKRVDELEKRLEYIEKELRHIS